MKLPAKLEVPSPETHADMQATAEFLEREMECEGGFRFAAGCPKTLLATCFGVISHEMLGTLPELQAARREQLVDVIASCQQADGTFRDPLHPDKLIHTLRKFTPTYLSWQETYFASHALDALGVAPAKPLRFIEPFRFEPTLMPWLGTLGFEDFWFVSNYLMFLLHFLVEVEGKESPAAHRVLDWLDTRQDPKTGFWGTQQGASLFNGLAGAFHLYGFYQYLGREIHYVDRAIESTLSVQQKSGLWSEPGGGPCEDLDAVDVLLKLVPSNADLDERVKAALRRALAALRAARLPSGGYCWTSPQRRARPRNVVYSGLPTLKVKSNKEDLWSIWFRPLAIAMAELRLGGKPAWPVKFRGKPLLGWHPAL